MLDKMDNDGFDLDIDDDYDEIFCKIYSTIKGAFVYHCTMCSKNFINNARFLTHLQQFHNFTGVTRNEEDRFSIEDSVDAESEHANQTNEVIEVTEDNNEEYISIAEGSEDIDNDDDYEEDTGSFQDNASAVNEATSLFYVDCEESENVPPTDNDDGDSSNEISSGKTTESHIQEIKEEENEEACVTCKICEKKFNTQDELDTHIFTRHYRKKRERKTEEKKYKCPICSLEIKDRSNLSSHVRRHSDDNKKYACSFCPKRFFSRTELRSHVRSHTGERPYLCSECGSSFASTGRLSSHITKNHTIRERKFKCDICGKAFFELFRLRNHKALHEDERSHPCSKCGAAFKERKTLLQHMKIHENKRSYKCTFCDASFNQRPGLNSHLKIVHKTQ